MSPHDHMAHFNIDYGSVTVVELQPQKKHAVEVELLNFCLLSDRAGARVRTARNAGRPGRRRGGGGALGEYWPWAAHGG
jgi:hypothetical protein